MKTAEARRRLPPALFRHVYHFEAAIDEAVARFAAALPPQARLLDAGAGEGQYKAHFHNQRYVGVDLGVGDESWNYRGLDLIANLVDLPFADHQFHAALNVVTLEHLREPQRALIEIGRVVQAGGTLLLVAPQDWEVHQAPHDYFRYTRYGLRMMLEQAGFDDVHVFAVGGYFRLLARRLLNGLQFFHGMGWILAALVAVPLAMVLPWLDSLDGNRDFTLGYTCTARKR